MVEDRKQKTNFHTYNSPLTLPLQFFLNFFDSVESTVSLTFQSACQPCRVCPHPSPPPSPPPPLYGSLSLCLSPVSGKYVKISNSFFTAAASFPPSPSLPSLPPPSLPSLPSLLPLHSLTPLSMHRKCIFETQSSSLPPR